MPLSGEQQAKLKDWFETKHINAACPACGSNEWLPGDIITAPVHQQGTTVLAGRAIPMIQLVCKQCANVRLFAAIPILGKDNL